MNKETEYTWFSKKILDDIDFHRDDAKEFLELLNKK